MSEHASAPPLAERVSAGLERVVGYACSTFIGAMTVVVIVGVFFRYVLNLPLSWTEEVSRYLMIWGASLAVSSGIRFGEHVGLTILLDSLKNPALRKALALFIDILVMFFLGLMLAYSLITLKDSSTQQTQALGISMLIPRLAIPVSMAAAIVQLACMAILRLSAKNTDMGPKSPVIIDI